MSAFPYRVADEAAFLERLDRMRAATHGGHLDPREIAAILREVEPLPWRVGQWYRIRIRAGRPAWRHVHGFDEAGQEHAIDVPQVRDEQWVTLEASPARRLPTMPGWPIGSMVFDLRDGTTALLGEMDIAEAEEIAA